MSRVFALSLLTWDSAISARSSDSSNSCCTFLNLLSHAKPIINVTHPSFQFLKLFLSTFHCQLLSLIQSVLLHSLKVSTGILFLFDIIPAPDFRFQGALHGIHNPLVIPLQLINFLILFCNFSVNFRLHLVQFKLNTEDLALFMFQRCLRMGGQNAE
uniref:Secreted protein n=1 Tax=Callorhinchus milii TaxID=7868 RepID=A0A4W3HEQ7_CALMI